MTAPRGRVLLYQPITESRAMSDHETRQAHWQQVWTTKDVDKVSWYQGDPAPSLRLIEIAGLRKGAGIIDVGGGQSPLAGCLAQQGFGNVAVLDISEAALAQAHHDLGGLGDDITWICEDVTRWRPVPGLFELWHDRAVFHFLTQSQEQQAYVQVLRTALAPGGWVVMATFAPDGPRTCSGLPVMGHDGASLSAILGSDFVLEDESREEHRTPAGNGQKFCWCLFRRR